MHQETSHEKSKLHFPLAVMAVVLLVASVTVQPALVAFADHDEGNQKSRDSRAQHTNTPDDKCPDKHGKYHFDQPRNPNNCDE